MDHAVLPRRVLPFLAAAVGAAAIASCDNGLAPRGVSRPVLAFYPVFEQAASVASVPVSKVRITLLRSANAPVAIDTVIDYPANQDSLVLALDVPVVSLTGSEHLGLRLAMTNAAGDTIFRAGPSPVTVEVQKPGTPPPSPAAIPVTYVGPGSNAARLRLAVHDTAFKFGDTITLNATAFDANNVALPNTPFVLFSADSNRIRVPKGTNLIVARPLRGVVAVVARTLTGQADTVRVAVQPVPSAVAVQGGNNQSGAVNEPLAQPVVVRVSAVDGPMAGVPVKFTVSLPNGTVRDSIAVTDVNGDAATSWRLGTTAGAMTMSAAPIVSQSITGSPVTFSATATPGVFAQLAVTANPTATVAAGQSLGTITLVSRDRFGNGVAAFTDSVVLQLVPPANLGAGPAPVLSGITRVKAVAGVATFTGISVNRAANGWKLAARAVGPTGQVMLSIPEVQTTAFAVTPAAASQLKITQVPQGEYVAGATPSPALQVAALDQFSNLVPGFTGVVSIALEANTAGATVSGTATSQAAAGVASFSAFSVQRAGRFVMRASATGLSAALTDSFTVNAAAPSQLVVLESPLTVESNTPFAVKVGVRDAFGNATPAFSGTVSLGIDPGTNSNSAVLGGTTSATSSGATIIISGVTIDRAGSGYRLLASSTGLTSATSGPLTATNSAPPSSSFGFNRRVVASLGSTVNLTAHLANGAAPASGVTVKFRKVGGLGHATINGDTLATVVTNANGDATVPLALSGTEMESNAVIAVGPDSIPLIFVAVSKRPGFHVWTQAGGSLDWETAGNWDTGVVPQSPADSVFIPALSFASGPQLTANRTIGTLMIDLAGTLDATNHQLTIVGDLLAETGTLSNAASVVLAGAGRRVRVNTTSPVTVTGSYQFTGLLNASTLDINGGRLADSSGSSVVIADSLMVRGATGRLVMRKASTVQVNRGAVFSGAGAGDTLFKAGTLSIGGDLKVLAAGAFNADSALTVAMNGTSAAQTISLTGGSGPLGTDTHFGSLFINNPSGVTLANDIVLKKQVLVFAGRPLNGVGRTVAFADTAASNAYGIVLTNAADWNVSNVTINRTGATSNTINLPAALAANLTIAASDTGHVVRLGSGQRTTLTGDLLVTTGRFSMFGRCLTVTGSALFTSGGALSMTSSTDTLDVVGPINFAGSTASVLTNGLLMLRNTLTVGISAQGLFSAGANHKTLFAGSSPQTVSMGSTTIDESITPSGFVGPDNGLGAVQNHFGRLELANGADVSLQTAVQVNNGLTLGTGSFLRQSQPLQLGFAGTMTDNSGGGLLIHGLRLNKANSSVALPSTFVIGGSEAVSTSGITIASAITLSSSATITGRVSQIGGGVTYNGKSLTINGYFRKVNGSISMSNTLDALTVSDSLVIIGGGSTLSAGTVTVHGDFKVRFDNGANQVGYVGSLNHKTVIDGAASTIFFDAANTGNKFQDLSIASSGIVTLASRTLVGRDLGITSGTLNVGGRTVSIGRNLGTSGTGVLRMQSSTDSVLVTGDVAFGGGSTSGQLTNGQMIVNGNFAQTGTTSFVATLGHKVVLKPSAAGRTISFALPDTGSTGSHFSTLELDNSLGAGTVSNSLLTNVAATGQLKTTGTPTQPRLVSGNNFVLAVGGVNADSITFDNAKLAIGWQSTIVKMTAFKWLNMGASATQLTIVRPSDGSAYPAFAGLVFDTPANMATSNGYHVAAFSPTTANAFTVSFTTATPTSTARRLAPVSPPAQAAIVNWSP